jgi:hypothetical protein
MAEKADPHSIEEGRVCVELTREEARDLQRYASSSSVMYHTQLAEEAEVFYAAISRKLEDALDSQELRDERTRLRGALEQIIDARETEDMSSSAWIDWAMRTARAALDSQGGS